MMLELDDLQMDQALIDTISWAEARLVTPTSWPTPHPAEGQSRERWLAEVAVARSQHDSAALHAGRLYREMLGTQDKPVGSVEYTSIEVAGTLAGDSTSVMGIKIYRPDRCVAGNGPHPSVVLFHGGAYWMGGGSVGYELNDELCRDYCADAGAVVVNVDYRLAPEVAFPGPLEDAYAAVAWVAEHASELGVDPTRIVVHGISSGGNLAAGAVQLCHDRGGPQVRGQILQAPSVNLSLDASRFTASEEMVAGVRRIVDLYKGAGDVETAPLSPGLRQDLTGLPPAYVIVGTFDPLHADGHDYAARLVEAGVAATVLEYPITHTIGTPDVLRRARAELLDAFRMLIDG